MSAVKETIANPASQLYQNLIDLSDEFTEHNLFGKVNPKDLIIKNIDELSIIKAFRKKQTDAISQRAKSFHAKILNSSFF